MTSEVKLYAKVIVSRIELPPLAAIRSGEVGEVIDAPPGRDASNVVWLKFNDGKIGWFEYREIQLLTDEDVPEDDMLISVGENKNGIMWLSIPNPTKECEVTYNEVLGK